MTEELDHGRRHFLGKAAMTLAAARFGVLRAEGASASQLAALGRATEWLNSPPLSATTLLGKVVLVQFGTYTCINWLRTLPYIRAWDQKYRKGFALIGVHTPEFAFEHRRSTTSGARCSRCGLGVPGRGGQRLRDLARLSTTDSWPALYFVDARGRPPPAALRRGRGTLASPRRAIQQLARRRRAAPADDRVRSSRSTAAGVELPRRTGQNLTVSGELPRATTANGHTSASPGGDRGAAGVALYAAPARLALNQWALAGEWTMGTQAAVLSGPTGRIVCRFHARDLHLVMGPPRQGELRTLPRVD